MRGQFKGRPEERCKLCARCQIAPEAGTSTAKGSSGGACGRRQVLAGVAGLGYLLQSGRGAQAATPQQSLEGGITQLLNSTATNTFTLNEKQLLEINRRVHKQNNVPPEFPLFVRNGFNIKVVADGYATAPSGLIYKDYEEGLGSPPDDGQEVEFHYSAYNENGARVDSSFSKGKPAKTRMGIKGLIPGFEEGIKTMKVGGRRRLVVPPDLGPPIGPSTFFSAKQCEVFDVELINVKSCRRRQVAMFSDVVCE